MPSSSGEPEVCVCCVCACHTDSNRNSDKIKIIYDDVTEHLRRVLWSELGPSYHERLGKKELNRIISNSIPLDHPEIIEDIKRHLKEMNILVEYQDEYGVNMAETS